MLASPVKNGRPSAWLRSRPASRALLTPLAPRPTGRVGVAVRPTHRRLWPPPGVPHLPPDTVLAVIDGKKLTYGELEGFLHALPPQMQQSAMTDRKEFIKRYAFMRKLTAMAEDFPEDKYDFKPTPAQRSFAEQLLHAAGSCYYFTNPAMGQKPPAAEDPKREQYKSKADIVAFVKKAFADGATAIQSKGEKGLMQTVVYGDQKARVLDIAYGIIEHGGEHYGQLVVYYRLAGLVPPESRPKK